MARAEIFDEAASTARLRPASSRARRSMSGTAIRPRPEPTLPATQPFRELGNVIMTPHVSGWTEGMLDARATLIAGNIARTARGETPLNVIKPAR